MNEHRMMYQRCEICNGCQELVKSGWRTQSELCRKRGVWIRHRRLFRVLVGPLLSPRPGASGERSGGDSTSQIRSSCLLLHLDPDYRWTIATLVLTVFYAPFAHSFIRRSRYGPGKCGIMCGCDPHSRVNRFDNVCGPLF